MKKNLGLQPYGELEAYSTTILPKEVGKLLNSREKESLDLQWAVLQATWLQPEPWDMLVGLGFKYDMI